MQKNILKFFSAAVLLNTLGCAANKTSTPTDPIEKVNRVTFAFNRGLDKVIVRPIAVGYDFITPHFVQTGISNFFGNIGSIPTALNDIFQGHGVRAGEDTWRFILNSTLGVAGLFDVAEKLGLPKNHQDFGLTLASWGYKNSSYFVLPILGPSSVRDTLGLPADFMMDLTNYVQSNSDGYLYAATGLNVINSRAAELAKDKTIDESKDPYAYVRDAYFKERNCAIMKNKNPKINCSSNN